MRRIGLVVAVVVGAWAMVAAVAVADEKVSILDACDPATFNATFGPGVCADVGGDVTVEEFLSPNILPEGHPGWRNVPSYMQIDPGEKVTIRNKGGETHTFTEVAAFGGGFSTLLNRTESPIAPECGSAGVRNPAVVLIPAGGQAAGDRARRGHAPLPVLHPSLDASRNQGGRRGGLSPQC